MSKIPLPFSALNFIHGNLKSLMSSNDDKFDFVDSNRIPYAVKFNRETLNFFSVADENGFIKFFTTYPKLKPIKEFSAQKSCIYDLQWLNVNTIACGGGDQYVSIFDVNTCVRLALLKGHTESVKSIAQLPLNPFVLASGSRDGSVLVFDIRFNKSIESSDETTSYIRAVNSIQKAHFTETNAGGLASSPFSGSTRSSNSRHLNVLKTKQNNLNHSHSTCSASLRRSSPVASVVFQNEHLLISAGATDGLIKVWDTRKIYTSSSAKKHVDQTPLYVLDNQLRHQNSLMASSSSKSTKGYSNIVLGNSSTRLYANCLNNNIYEFNVSSYNENHTRLINESTCHSKQFKPVKYHINQSNYIKSSISQCDNFILTGSSDHHAYIYSTSLNSSSERFRKNMPVIVLKGHTNEVTAVDWNPHDSNQIVTCSDDNTIRLWNVKRDIDALKSSECNFCQAETINEYETSEDSTVANAKEASIQPSASEEDKNYISLVHNYNRIYTKYMPQMTGVYDDFLFTGFEYNHFIKCKVKPNGLSTSTEFDLEKELCIKCENININIREKESHSETSSASVSPTTQMIRSIEQELAKTSEQVKVPSKEFYVLQLETPTSNMPINLMTVAPLQLVEEAPVMRIDSVEPEHNAVMFKRQSSSTMLVSASTSASSAGANFELKPKKKTYKQRRRPDASMSTPQPKHLKTADTTELTPASRIALTASKKRNAVETADQLRETEHRTPVSKRRLILTDQTATTATAAAAAVASPMRTILHYFSPKPPPRL